MQLNTPTTKWLQLHNHEGKKVENAKQGCKLNCIILSCKSSLRHSKEMVVTDRKYYYLSSILKVSACNSNRNRIFLRTSAA